MTATDPPQESSDLSPTLRKIQISRHVFFDLLSFSQSSRKGLDSVPPADCGLQQELYRDKLLRSPSPPSPLTPSSGLPSGHGWFQTGFPKEGLRFLCEASRLAPPTPSPLVCCWLFSGIITRKKSVSRTPPSSHGLYFHPARHPRQVLLKNECTSS